VGGCANTSPCAGIGTPRGAIPGMQVGGGANASACAGIGTPRGTIPGTEVGGGTVVGPGSVILGVDSTVGGAMFAGEGALGFARFPDRSPPAYGSL
jgi:hypothetical protein